jgi:type I restriction enzyme R subunit
MTEDETATLASRLAKLELELTPPNAPSSTTSPGGRCATSSVASSTPSTRHPGQSARRAPPTPTRLRDLLERAVEPIAANPDLRTRILELRATHDRVIDEVSKDVLLDAHGVVDPSRAKSVVESWAQYLLDHRDEITAIQLVTEAKERRIAFADIQELADRISRPPHNWTPDIIWNAYEAVDVDRVRHSDRHTLTDLVSLLRYTVGLDNELVPYADRVQERYAAWLAQQAQAGSEFSPLERWWLDRMVDVIASSRRHHRRRPRPRTLHRQGRRRRCPPRPRRPRGDLLDELNAELTA